MNRLALFVIILILITVFILAYVSLKNISYLKKEKDAKNEGDEGTSNHYAFKAALCGVIAAFLLAVLAIPGFINDTISMIEKIIPGITMESEDTTQEHRDTTTSTTTTTTTTTTTMTTYTTTTEPISSNEVTKQISHIDDYYTVSFIAPMSGKYRFDFLTDDTQTNYGVSLIDSKNDIIMESDYNTYLHGETRDLIRNEVYTLTISQMDGFPKATVIIYVPSEDAVLNFHN